MPRLTCSTVGVVVTEILIVRILVARATCLDHREVARYRRHLGQGPVPRNAFRVSAPSYHAPPMIDHLSLGVADLARAAAFYDAVLVTLGYVRVLTHPRAVGYGRPGDRDEQLALLASGDQASAPGTGFHLALTAKTRAAVDAFHAGAVAAGATDEGAPGLRPQYGPGYYAAFIRDLDGHKIEAVFHEA